VPSQFTLLPSTILKPIEDPEQKTTQQIWFKCPFCNLIFDGGTHDKISVFYNHAEKIHSKCCVLLINKMLMYVQDLTTGSRHWFKTKLANKNQHSAGRSVKTKLAPTKYDMNLDAIDQTLKWL
jgi:hypothetical protein